ncbi:STAS domain-containing protein [Streptomyces sp. NPDC096079]|uniref:STAS domain-containing protein n=1 Tax=Streptomyces sp. NPDC096079 TaxID=3155820 RepID=UPI0033250DCC
MKVVADSIGVLGEIATEQLLIRLTTDMEGNVRALVRGEIDIQGAPELHRALARVLDGTHGCLVVNLAEVSFCDCSALNVLLRLNARARRTRGRLILEAPSTQVTRLLSLTRSRNIFTIRVVTGH